MGFPRESRNQLEIRTLSQPPVGKCVGPEFAYIEEGYFDRKTNFRLKNK